MCQSIEDYHYFYLRHTPQYNNVLNCLITTMGISGFTSIQSPITNPENMFSFIFVPTFSFLNELQEPFRRYCSFKSKIYVQINQFLHKVQCQIIICELTSDSKKVQLKHYLHLTKRLQIQMRTSPFSKSVHFNLCQNIIETKFCEVPVLYFLQEGYIKVLFSDVKKNVVQLFLMNKEYHDQLTTNETIMFQIQHSIHQRDMYFFQAQRHKKELDLFKIKQIQRRFQENIQKKRLVELITGQKHKKPDRGYFTNLLAKSSQKKKQIKSLIQQRQGDKQHMQNQFGITIYEYTLNEKTFPTQTMGLRSGNESSKKTLVKKNRSMCICQGITIMGMNKQKNRKLEQIKLTTNLSSVQFIQCFIRYHLSIHQSTNQHQTEIEGVQENFQEESKQIRQKDIKQDKSIDSKLLVRKKCFELGKKPFVNEYNFIKYMRHKVFPYISKYYLQQIPEDSNTNNDTNNAATITTSYQQELEQITKKAIYMQDYQIHMAQYLTGRNSNPIQNQQFYKPQKIVHILFQLIATLRYLSYFNILHRDIKLNNIMMHRRSYSYQVKLIDWGSVYMDWAQKPINTTNRNNVRNNVHRQTQGNLQNSNSIDSNNQNVNQNINQNINNPNTSNSPHPERKPTLITSHTYIQTYHQLKETNNTILQTEFNNCPHKFQTNEYFDIYSYGHIVGHFIDKLKAMLNPKHWLIEQLEYLQNKCLNANPYHRLSPFQIMVYLHHAIYVLKMKTVTINNLRRNQQNIIDSVQ